jgi:8-oxo-dGTP diphosphatase
MRADRPGDEHAADSRVSLVIDRFQVVPSAYLIFRRTVEGGDQVLLMLRAGTGYMDGHWATVAGHVEVGESCAAAAVREAREEVGAEVDIRKLRPVCGMHRTGGDGQGINERVDFFFETRVWTGEPRRLEPHRAAALAWFGLGSLPTPVVPHENTVLTNLSTGRVPAVITFGFTDA